ncbi:MAG: hypothetical protein WCK51_05515 [Armatimonadota bacterium]
MRTLVRLGVTCLILAILGGCGGSSGAGENLTGILPKATIDWPDISRGFQASKFALSARIRVTPSAEGGAVSSWVVDRPAGTSAQTRTYSGTDVKVTGPVSIEVQFLSGTGATGDTVATAVIAGRVLNDGSLRDSEGNPLGSVASEGTITELVAFGSDPSGEVGTTVNATSKVILIGRTGSGNFIALNQAQIAPRISSSVVSGASLVSAQGPNILGLAEGEGRVAFVLDGFRAETNVRISPRLASVRTLDVQASAIAYDWTRNQFWATFNATGPNANGFTSINPTSGVLGTTVNIGGEASLLTVSGDGTAAYVSVPNTNSVTRISLATGAVGSPINVALEGSGNPTSIAVNPVNGNEVAVTVKGTQSTANWGPVIIRDGAVLPNYITGSYSDMSRTAYLDSSTLIGASGETTAFPTAKATVSSNGCVLAAVQNEVLPGFGMTSLITKDGKGVTNNGTVFDGSTLSRSAQLDYEESSVVNSRASFVTTDTTNNLVWFLFLGQDGFVSRIRAVDTNTWTFTDAVTAKGIQGEVRGLHRFGTNGIAIHTTQAIYTIDAAPGL